jgi:hypothetical protein
MVARCQEERACADHEECLMQAKTAVSWHVRPPSEAESVIEEGPGPMEEGPGPMKEENLLLVSRKPTVFERNRAHGEHISLRVERKGAFRQGFPPLAEAICLSLFPKLLSALMVPMFDPAMTVTDGSHLSEQQGDSLLCLFNRRTSTRAALISRGRSAPRKGMQARHGECRWPAAAAAATSRCHPSCGAAPDDGTGAGTGWSSA